MQDLEKIELPNYGRTPPYGGSTLDWWCFFVRPYQWPLAFYLSINILRQSFFRSQPLFFGILVGLIETGKAQENPMYVVHWLALYAVCALIAFTSLSIIVPSHKMMDKISKHVSLFGLRHYIDLSENWHENRASGEKLQRLLTARHSTFHFLSDSYWNLSQLPAIAIAVAAAITTLQASLVYIFMFYGMVVTYILLSFISGSWLIKKFAHFNKTQETLVGKVYEFVVSTATVRYFNLRNHILKSAEEGEVPNYQARIDNFKIIFKRWLALDCIALVWIISILSVASYDILYGSLSLAAFTAIIFLTLGIWGQLEPLAMSYTKLIEYWEGFKRLTEVLHDKPDIQDAPQAVKLSTATPDIAFEDVSFHYQKGEVVIENFSLNIKAGEKIGLIGPSGAGKSTIVKLLMRFYDLEKGGIKINGHDLRTLQRASLQENVAVIPQDVMLFNHPLIENIRYGNLAANDEDVMSAAQKAHAEEFIHNLPDGYHTIVGERGVKLSGGQRQRIAIARAMLKDAPILVLDEATSALDSESEKYIQQSLKGLMKDKTVIAIAHRLSTIAHLDRLIVMDNGTVVEEGTHEDLLSQNGLYAKLWSMQSGGFLGAAKIQ